MTNANEHNGRSLKLNMHLVATYQDHGLVTQKTRLSAVREIRFCKLFFFYFNSSLLITFYFVSGKSSTCTYFRQKEKGNISEIWNQRLHP